MHTHMHGHAQQVVCRPRTQTLKQTQNKAEIKAGSCPEPWALPSEAARGGSHPYSPPLIVTKRSELSVQSLFTFWSLPWTAAVSGGNQVVAEGGLPRRLFRGGVESLPGAVLMC